MGTSTTNDNIRSYGWDTL